MALTAPTLGDATWSRRLGARAGWALALLGPVLAVATGVALSRAGEGAAQSTLVRLVLLADLVYVLALVSLIFWTIGRMIAARRRQSAGSRLHLRMSGLFTLVALAPTVIVAVFATLTVNFGLEAWFSNQVGSVVRNALATAEAYEREHRGAIRGEALAMANDLNRAVDIGIDAGRLGELVRQQQLLRALPEAYVLDGEGEIIARGEFSYLFTLETPTPEQFAAARSGEVVLIDDEANNELRALVHLVNMIDGFLYITQRVEGDVLLLLDETRETVALYERLEGERARVLFEFALLYLGFAALVILAAVWMGLWFAERLSRPIGRLAEAAAKVGEGDLDRRVKEPKGDDEVALLSRVFNRMTRQLKGQRDALVAAAAETEERRRFIETVLSGVSAGVIGLDPEGRVELLNDAACEMLGFSREEAEGAALDRVAPALEPLLARARRAPGGAAQDQLRLLIEGGARDFTVRVTPKSAEGSGWVMTIDDMTELVAAQRIAAWGDVARRIAHEIKNPLTPIQLSADRLRSKFRKLPEAEQGALAQYADVISRQAGDIRRMVDEFSRFARMPEPKRELQDVAAIAREATMLREASEDGVRYVFDGGDAPALAAVDRGLLAQALANLVKNAAESVETARAETPDRAPPPGTVSVRVATLGDRVEIVVADDGLGLPEEDRARLVEPYVTTRPRGTGLGLAIVKKIVEQHEGLFALEDAEPFGARARISLPLPPRRREEDQTAA